MNFELHEIHMSERKKYTAQFIYTSQNYSQDIGITLHLYVKHTVTHTGKDIMNGYVRKYERDFFYLYIYFSYFTTSK